MIGILRYEMIKNSYVGASVWKDLQLVDEQIARFLHQKSWSLPLKKLGDDRMIDLFLWWWLVSRVTPPKETNPEKMHFLKSICLPTHPFSRSVSASGGFATHKYNKATQT